jgi:parallel beta-helix repeat protein
MTIRTAVVAAILTTVFFTSGRAATFSISVPTKYKTIAEAMLKAREGDTIWVEDGVYTEPVLIKPGIVLAARNPLKATLRGDGRGTLVELTKNSSIYGFVVTNATIGIFSHGAENTIEKCRVARNWQTGILVVRHLPKIIDNIIAFNKASGIQGWDVRSTVATINHNTIAYNGNHGIAVGGKSEIVIENNVIANNKNLGLKLSRNSRNSKVTHNNFYKNMTQLSDLPEGNFSFDPAFVAPRKKLDFQSDPKLCCSIKATDNENLGARF